jgi:hypothetical protein
MQTDLFEAMKTRPGVHSDRPLGNTANVALWGKPQVDSLWEGVFTAWKLFFRREFDLRTFSRMVLCEGMQESTGDFRLGCKPVDFGDHTSHGFMQVTPGSVLKDFANHGKVIRSALKTRRGVVLARPDRTLQMDTSDPGLNVVIFAWYTKNSVLMGVSMQEYAHRVAWNIPPGNVTPIFGNCQLCWLAGPHNDFLGAGAAAFRDYHARILDYYTGAGFGDVGAYEALIRTRIVPPFVLVQRSTLGGTRK